MPIDCDKKDEYKVDDPGLYTYVYVVFLYKKRKYSYSSFFIEISTYNANLKLRNLQEEIQDTYNKDS